MFCSVIGGQRVFVENKKILVFGGTGSLGQALIRRLARQNSLVMFSRDEAKHWTLRNQYIQDFNLSFIVGDVRDKDRVKQAIKQSRPDIIIHAAALKQVETCELSPDESIKTNVLGVQNVVESVLALEASVANLEKMLLVSTDKACAPTNVYGMCKAISERIVTSASKLSNKTSFIGVRYGNVLESRGSIIPLFRFQGELGKNITLTHNQMTRFIMTLDESISLIEATINSANSGEIWLPKLKSMKIKDLAEIFAERYKCEIVETGIRPGEKIHEQLISEPESLRTIEEKNYFRMGPAFEETKSVGKSFAYSSQEKNLQKADLKEYLQRLNIFETDLKNFVGKTIEEIRTN